MRNASMKVLKNLVCCAAFICLMFVLAMPAHAASKADELLQLLDVLVDGEFVQAKHDISLRFRGSRNPRLYMGSPSAGL